MLLVCAGRHECCHVCVPAFFPLLSTTVHSSERTGPLEAAVSMSPGCSQSTIAHLALTSITQGSALRA